jgi:hypothetical protein
MYPVRGVIHPNLGGFQFRSSASATLEFDDQEKEESHG